MDYLNPQSPDLKAVFKRDNSLYYNGNPLHYTNCEALNAEIERQSQYNSVMQCINPGLLKFFKPLKSDSSNLTIKFGYTQKDELDYKANLAGFKSPEIISNDLKDSERLEALIKSND